MNERFFDMKKFFTALIIFVLLTTIFLLVKNTKNSLHTAKAANTTNNIVNYNAFAQEHILHIKKVPQRVLIMYPGVTELMIRLGLEKNILATIRPYGEEPDDLKQAYAELNKIKAPYVPSREEALNSNPDLIIGWAHNFTPTELGTVDLWQNFGIPAYIVPGTLLVNRPTMENSVYPLIADLGKIFNVNSQAQTYIKYCQSRVAALQKKSFKNNATVVILQEQGKGNYYLYGEDYLIDDISKKAGLQNLVQKGAASVGVERLLSLNPDYIIYVSLPGIDGENISDEQAENKLMENSELNSLVAVRQKHIINLPYADVNSGNDRLIDSLAKIIKAINNKKH